MQNTTVKLCNAIGQEEEILSILPTVQLQNTAQYLYELYTLLADGETENTYKKWGFIIKVYPLGYAQNLPNEGQISIEYPRHGKYECVTGGLCSPIRPIYQGYLVAVLGYNDKDPQVRLCPGPRNIYRNHGPYGIAKLEQATKYLYHKVQKRLAKRITL